MGGYCVAGKKVALWNFELPSFPENATLLSATFDGRHNAGNTAVYYRGEWASNSSLGYSQAMNAWNSSDFVGTASSSGGYFSAPLNIDLFGGQFQDDYLILTGYNGSGLSFYNSGSLAPKLRLIVNIPNELCDGDMNDDEIVDITDLLATIEGWGTPYNITDLLIVIEHWGSTCELPGACCLPNGTCESTDAAGCESAGGNWNGTNTFCSMIDCPELGACCLEDESCEVLLSDVCKNAGGSFRGADTNCTTIDCSVAEYNDECVDATPVSGGTIEFLTTMATTSNDLYSDQLCTGTYLGVMNKDVWFSYTATCTGILSVSTCDMASFDTDLVVYEGLCNDKTQIACNGDSTCSGYTSYLETPVTSGEQYLIRLGGWDASSFGQGSLVLECTTDE
jgi:hypothetical protein